MPRFAIKRKTREPEPEVVPEEQEEESDFSLDQDSEPSEEEPPLEEQMEAMGLAPRRTIEPKRQPQAQYAPRRRAREATLAHQRTYPAERAAPEQYRGYQPPRKLNRTRSIDYPKPLRRTGGRAKIAFRSHYGANGDQLSTQDKARLLYKSCFG